MKLVTLVTPVMKARPHHASQCTGDRSTRDTWSRSVSRRAANRRRPWDVSSLVLPALVLLAAVGGLALIAGSLGWFESGPGPRRGAPPGTLAVPAAAVTIPTYARVGLEHLIDRSSGELRAVYLPEGSILPETMIDAKQIGGRVLSTDKAPGQVFSTQDFFPLGTREGIVAGIPPGKRALRIGAGKVNGIVGLGRGDHALESRAMGI